METMEELIKILGPRFRGLWRSYTLTAREELLDEWTVTFIWKGQYVETPSYSNPFQALNFAKEKIENGG